MSSKQIIHIDMDAFYASVEELDNPTLIGKPVIVGGKPEQRGVVSAANYKAREFGVTSAMPSATALRLCPEAILIKPNHQRYQQISDDIFEIFKRYTPIIQPLSLDEAFLDANESTTLFGSIVKIASEIKKNIREQLNLTASIGIAPNKFLAKLASDADKPDGFVIVYNDSIHEFLDPLDVARLWGIGKSTNSRLRSHGIVDVKSLRSQSLEDLELIFTTSLAKHLWNLSRGIDNRIVSTSKTRKSISRETTFQTNVEEINELRRNFITMTEDVCSRLRHKSLLCKTVHIKFRLANFKTFTRSKTLTTANDNTNDIWQTINSLIDQHIAKNTKPLRLIGVGLSNLCDYYEQQNDIFSQNNSPIDLITDKINIKYGKNAISRAKGLRKTNS